ncbi:S8 family serine peptidase [Campylobacter hyointestinalis]|uniref:S8 family serine peptidase n=1 Tax=Campylobacter hyointestinalis TaxID=198 RepID=A0A562XDL1_CAMHY|nr:S8 family serine peptidase [Campylobacter hyointestinalis]TWO19766.1 S8 family serine peptidase [Campylobacter hyointestinalis]
MNKISKITFSLVCATVLLSNANASTQANEVADKLINLDKARQENPNLNGAGVVVGVVDSVFNTNNPILKDKLIGSINNNIDSERFGSHKSTMLHGTQVASLIVGNSSDLMGVANGATFYGLAYLNPSPSYNGNLKADVEKMIQSGVKVINHSYASDGFALINRKWDDGLEFIDKSNQNSNAISYAEFQKLVQSDISLKRAQILAELSKQYGILNVVGIGNDGFISPRANSILPSYDESYRGLLAVGGVNADKISTQNDGKFKISGIAEEDWKAVAGKWSGGRGDKSETILKELITKQGIFSYSNFFKGGASLYGVVAPAQNLTTANGRYNYKYYEDGEKIDKELTINSSSGTSFATPLVSGVAVLVEQKFPFLKGSQIADVILTTANTNVTLPELIVTKNVGKTGTANFYSVFYITKDVPKNGNDVNLDQVKQDLINAGFKTSDGDSTIAKYIIDNLLKSNADVSSKDKTYPISVVKLSKEEIIGSGILDAQKALKGLAAININRLNPNDIQELDDGNGVKKYYAFYTIDTKGQNGGFAFTNDIDEIKWDEKYHLNDAINSLKSDDRVKSNLPTLQAGFIKTGDGALKFSQNTLNYYGPTMVRGGILEFDRVTAENSALYADNGGQILISGETNAKQNLYAINGGEARIIGKLANGDVFARNRGMISGTGTIAKNLTNESGIVMPGGAGQIGVLNVNGTYTQNQNGNLHINFNNTTNSDIIATNYDIKGGNLVYIPLSGEFFQNGQEITINFNKLSENGNLDKFTNISVLDTSTLNFKLKDNNTIISSENTNSFGNQSSENINPPSSENNKPNNENNENNELENKNNSNQSSENINPPSNENTNNSSNSNTIIVEVKEDAYKPTNASPATNFAVSQSLMQIRNSVNLSPKYQTFFKELDTTSQDEKQEILSSTNPNDTLSNTKDTLNFQNRSMLNNISFLAGGSLSNAAKVAAIAKNSQLALINSDMADNMVYDILQNYNEALSKSEISSKVSYTNFKGDGYKTNAYSVDLNTRKWISDDVRVGAFLNYSYQNGDYKFSDLKSQIVSVGLNGLKDFGVVSLIGGVDFGLAFNDMERQILTQDTKLQADYKSYFVSTELGISKDFIIGDNLVWTPISILNYIYSKQDGFKESGGILAKGYNDIDLDTLNLSLGGNLAYSFISQNNTFTTLNGFAFYTRRLNSDNFASKEYFVDASNSTWTHNYKLNKDSVYFGIDTNIEKGNKFIKFLISSEIAKNEHSINTAITAGLRF